MDQRSRITARLAAETTAGWPSDIVADKDDLTAHATNKLADALGTVSLVFPATLIIEEATQVAALSEWLEISRLRLRLTASNSPEDADLSMIIQASHDMVIFHLTKLSATITRMEAMMPLLLGVRPDELQKIYGDATTAAMSALGPDQHTEPVGLEFRLGLLLLVTDAIPPLPDDQTAKTLEWAQAQGLLPADRMIGMPIYSPELTDQEPAKPSDKIFIKLPDPFRSKFATLCTALPWSENECVNQLLLAHASHPLGAHWKVQYEARRTITGSLVGGCLTLRGLADEADYCGFKLGIVSVRSIFEGDHFTQIDVNRAPLLIGGVERGYQPGSLQLLASLNSDSTLSVPQSFLPARRGCF